jgi:5-(carboxyamino)imidazole ribonucleotide synthase
LKSNQKTIGILGGGQLARMMALKAHQLGMNCSIMSSSKDDPAAQVTSSWYRGDVKVLADVKKFIKSIDVLTFESEFASLDILTFLDEQKEVEVHPSPKLMMTLQDRLSQKQLLDKYKIPTSPFGQLEKIEDLDKLKLKKHLVFKARKDGYDGKGTYILKKINDPKFHEFFQKQKAGVIWENFIPFKRELAIILVRNKKGDIVFLPLVESYQEEYRCLWVKGPVKHEKLNSLKRKLKKLVEGEKYVGVIAFELFDDGKKLLVNEVAPRVHNTGHYSQDALTEGQFSLHLNAVLNNKLFSPKSLHKAFAMYNLIGSSEVQASWRKINDCHLHWYGKKKNYAGRKMGHLNAIGSTPNQALNKLKKMRKDIKI